VHRSLENFAEFCSVVVIGSILRALEADHEQTNLAPMLSIFFDRLS
jgi:hypothetical protein